MKKRIVWITVLLMGILLLTGCGKLIAEKADSSGITASTQRILDALLRDDFDVFIENVSTDLSFKQISRGYYGMREILRDVEEYTLSATNWKTNTMNGVTQTSVRFIMDCGEEMFWVDVVKASTENRIGGFMITPYEKVTVTGTFTTLEANNKTQYLFLYVGVIELVFLVWMLIDTLRLQKGKRGIWFVIVLLANLVGMINVIAGNFGVQCNFGMFWTYTALLNYSTGGFSLRLFIPVGALIYVANRKKLKKEDGKSDSDQKFE